MAILRRRLGTLSISATLAISLLGLSGCQQINDWLGIKDPWAGYYDSTENFIAASGLDRNDTTAAGYQTPAAWTWGWRNDSDGATFDYMTLTKNTTLAPPSSLPSTTPVYDLALVNLYPGNGGDFESAATAPPANWGLNTGAAASTNMQLLSAAGVIHGGKSVQVNTEAKDYVWFDLSTLEDHLVSSITHTYSWRFFLTSGSWYASQVTALASFDPSLSAPILMNSTADVLLSDIAVGASTSSGLIFGSSAPLKFTMDDIRVTRSDIKDDSSLRLLLRPSDALLSLRSGYYEFSVWVRKPVGSHFVSESSAALPYASAQVTLLMLSVAENKEARAVYSIDGSVPGYDSGAGWVHLVLRMNAGGNFTLDSSSTKPVMELAVYPFSTAAPDVGMVEIADPELHYFLNGY